MPFPRHQEVNFWKVRVLRLGLNWERLGIGWGGGGGGVGWCGIYGLLWGAGLGGRGGGGGGGRGGYVCMCGIY